jgi:hypothetical protein
MQTPIKKSLNRKCKICAKKFTTQFFYVWWCSTQCGYELSMRLKEKRQAQEMKEKREKLKSSIQTTSDLRKDLQTEINAIVRAIDFGSGCISCGNVTTLESGHYYHKSKTSARSCTFHLWNLFGQCKYCNKNQHGNLHDYRLGVIKIYGNEIFELIEMLPEMYRNLTWSKDELKEAIKIARQIFKDLPKNKTYSVPERIELRKTINDKLNLYLI